MATTDRPAQRRGCDARRAKRGVDRFIPPRPHVGVDTFGGAPQGELTQREEVAASKEAFGGALSGGGQIDEAGLQALEEIVGRQVEELDLVSAIEDVIGHGLFDNDMRDLGDGVVEAFDVLHVQRGPDIDAVIEQLEHILPALLVARARRVVVGELIDEQQGRRSRDGGVEIEFLQRRAPVIARAAGQGLGQGRELGLGLRAAMGLDAAEDDVDTMVAFASGGLQHRKGFADAGGVAKENLQAATRPAGLGGLHLSQQHIGIGSLRVVVHRAIGVARVDDDNRAKARLTASTDTRGSPKMPNKRSSLASSTAASICSRDRPRAPAMRSI